VTRTQQWKFVTQKKNKQKKNREENTKGKSQIKTKRWKNKNCRDIV